MSLQIKMFLSKGAKLLDTTTSIPNYKTACPPPGKSFVSRCHMFTSMIAVQNFWSDLKCVCLNTPLGKFGDGFSVVGAVFIKRKSLSRMKQNNSIGLVVKFIVVNWFQV